MLKKMKEKLYRRLFPSKLKEFEAIRSSWQQTVLLNVDSNRQIEELRAKLFAKEQEVKPTMADLMRDTLKLVTLDFVSQEKGVPRHFLDLGDTLDGKDKRNMYIAQLAQIHELEVWKALTQYLINAQGNYTLRVAPTDMEVFAGRMQISGIELVKGEVNNGYEEYMISVGPKEDFDPTDHSTEGISFSEDQKD